MSVDKGRFRRGQRQRETFDFHTGEFAPARWKSDDEIERYVPTHCCYCGVPCGMYLKVAGGKGGRRRAARRPALILLDLSIPSTTDTADFLRHLRARWFDACGELPQIIVLTTSKQVQEDLAPEEHVVLKPFHVRDLLALIQRVIPFAP